MTPKSIGITALIVVAVIVLISAVKITNKGQKKSIMDALTGK